MPNLTFEDVPDELQREFQQLPKEERRRLGAQIVSSLQDQLLKRQPQNGPSKLERVRAFQKEHAGELLDPAIVEEALNMGRGRDLQRGGTAGLVVHGVTEELHMLLTRRAAENRRTLNDEVLVVLDEGVHTYRACYDRPSLEEIRAFRESLNVPPLTEEFLERAINEGRP